MSPMRKQRDLPVTIYRILLYLNRMRNTDDSTRRLVRISKATGIDRKELKGHLIALEKGGLVASVDSGEIGRGGHLKVTWETTEVGKMKRQDIGIFIQLGEKLGYYPQSFNYLPSDNLDF